MPLCISCWSGMLQHPLYEPDVFVDKTRNRMQPFLRPQYHESPIHSNLWRMLAGMMLRCEFLKWNWSCFIDLYSRLTSCMSQLSQGKLFNSYDVKWIFLINIAIFEIGILISGLAPSSVVFIVGRAITGLGFSGISQGCMMYNITCCLFSSHKD